MANEKDWTVVFYSDESGRSPVEEGNKLMKEEFDYVEEGKRSYQRWLDQLHAKPGYKELYEEEAAKKELWLQLVEARQRAGITQAELARRLGVSQAQVARMEKHGYESYTLNSLRKYVKALGEGFSLDVSVRYTAPASQASPRLAVNQ